MDRFFILLCTMFLSLSCLTAEELPQSLWTRTTGHDWPQFLGPDRNSKSAETGLLVPWPKAGPRVVWSQPLGTGYAIGSVAYGRFYQFDKIDGQATLLCLNAETGKELWRFAYESQYKDLYGYNDGPRCSPLVDGNRVYIFGVEGMLHCLTADTGKLLWKRDTNREFGVIQNFFGVGSGPIIEGELLLAMIGGSPAADAKIPSGQLDRVSANGSAVVAFDKFTGKTRYQLGEDLASYASLQSATIARRRWGFAFCRGGLIGFDPQAGKIDFHYPWRAKLLESVNASTPVVVKDQVFISETYGVGSSLLQVAPGEQQVVWSDEDRGRGKAMLAHWNTPVYHDGFLYGSSGRHSENAELRCLDWKTGKVQWSVPELSRTSLLYADSHFLMLGEYGDLTLFRANSEKFELVSHTSLIDPTAPRILGVEPRGLLKYPCWAAPILAHGLLYVRGDDRLVCLELRGEK
jgi:outer membrane protein assembly factor BamB